MQPLEVRANGVWLSLVGDVGDISYSHTWGVEGTPGGCELAEWSFSYPAEHTPPFLRRGLLVEIHDGSGRPAWSGISTEPERDGNVWRCHARGYGFEGNRFKALDSTGGTTTNPDVAIRQAIIRGLGWVYPGGFTNADVGPAGTVSVNDLSDLLDYAATQAGKRWWVDADRTVRTAPDPTTPTWVATPEVLPPGVADDSYVSALVGRFITAMSGTPPVASDYGMVTVTDADAIARWGRVEEVVDYTTLGQVMSSSAVAADLQNRMKLAGARMGYTNALTLTRDNVTTIGGVHAAPSQIVAGSMLRLSRFVDVSGNLAVGMSTDLVIQRTTYNHADDAVTVEPLGLAPRDLSSILASPEKPETTGVEIDG